MSKPKRIYLENQPYGNWSSDQENEDDIEYVRADLLAYAVGRLYSLHEGLLAYAIENNDRALDAFMQGYAPAEWEAAKARFRSAANWERPLQELQVEEEE